MSRSAFPLGCTLLLLVALGVGGNTSRTVAAEEGDAAVARTRKMVRQLDDLYKTAIVLVTEHYVKDDSDLPAGGAFKALFASMKEKGWHEVRLVDATGQPIEEENAPRDGFEKEAIQQLKSGKPYFDKVVTNQEGRYLHAMTAVPVVMEKCVMCHDHYKQAPKGAAIGGLSYIIRVE